MKKLKVDRMDIITGLIVLVFAPGVVKGVFEVGQELGKAIAQWL